jgi:hypothetical protein
MDEDLGQVEINFSLGEDVSPLELDELTARLQRELSGLEVESVDRVSTGPAPDGARGIDLAAVGVLLVNLGKATPVLGQVVEVIQAWANRGPNRTVKLTIDGDTLEINGMSEKDQHVVIKDWMARHPKAAAARGPAT